jgi:hypothetical protein
LPLALSPQLPLTTDESIGFAVLAFEDHPQYFENWRAHIQRGPDFYEVISDSREGWLTLWHKKDGKGERVFEAESTRLAQEQELALIQKWLETTKNP